MDIFRSEFNKLKKWYDGPLRKSPCVLYGARQVGKSTLAERFAKKTGREVFVVNFWKDTDNIFPKIFSPHAHVKDVLSKLEIHFNCTINPETSILILDEIQEHPPVYSLFKTFKEDTNLPVIATGSYLKLFLAMNPNIELPIGCTYELLVTPMTFGDFLYNANNKLFNIYQNHPLDQIVDDVYHQQFLEYYYEYLFTGGMPEVVDVYLSHKNQSKLTAARFAREIQQQLLAGYHNDFLTFGQKNKFVAHRNIAQKLALTFSTIPKELAKYKSLEEPVGRFKFTALGKNEEFKRVSHVFDYLSLAGLIIKSHVIKNLEHPLLNENENKNAFKCFYFDVGMLQAALNIPYQKIIGDELSHYKGPIAENFVAQELFAGKKQDLLSWKDGHHHEVEFLYEEDGGFIPIEVKASKKSLASKSLNHYIKKQNSPMAIKVAPRNFGKNGAVISIPIYFMERITDLFNS